MSTSVSIRTANFDDAQRLAEVAEKTFPLACPPTANPNEMADFIADRLSPEQFRDYLGDSARLLLVAEYDNKVCGYSMFVRAEVQDSEVATALSIYPTVELSKCYVLPEHHGKGIAGELIIVTLDAARREGASGMWLGVNQHNARAIRFYEKNGFSRVGFKTFEVSAQVHNDFIMEKALN